MKEMNKKNHCDVILIGSGIMSATLGVLLKKLVPQWTIKIFERMDKVAMESSEAWNNAGTGHSAFCELNYTSENTDGSTNVAQSSLETSNDSAILMALSILIEPSVFSDV